MRRVATATTMTTTTTTPREVASDRDYHMEMVELVRADARQAAEIRARAARIQANECWNLRFQIEARDAELERAADQLALARRRASAYAAALAAYAAAAPPPPPPWSPREEGIASGWGPASSTDGPPAPPQ